MLTLSFQLPNASIEDLVLDAVLSEQHSSSAEVTQFPVETGTNISDHVRQQPDKLRIEGVVSNTPLQSRVASASDVFATDMKAGIYSTRAQEVYAKLIAIKESATMATISTELKSYGSMVLQTLEAPRNAETGDSMHFTADFVHVITVSTQTVALPKSPKPGRVHAGKQPKKAVEETQSVPHSVMRKSVLAIGGQ